MYINNVYLTENENDIRTQRKKNLLAPYNVCKLPRYC